jgi:hypothetical protein
VSGAVSHIVHASSRSQLAPLDVATAVTNKPGAAWAGTGGGAAA